jgi:hypothetical protein
LALSDADHLEALKTARDSIVAQMASGRLTIDYMIRGRRHTTRAPDEALRVIEEQIERYEAKASRGSRKVFRLASLQRPRGRDC